MVIGIRERNWNQQPDPVMELGPSILRFLPETGVNAPVRKPQPTIDSAAAAELAALMEGVVRRDAKALEGLYDRFNKVIFSVVLSIVRKKEDAEEILCEVFLQVWDKAPAYDSNKGSVYGWLLTMARNRAIDRIRSKGFKSGKREAGEIEDMDLLAHPDRCDQLDSVVLSERAETVRGALARISADQRRVLEQAYFEGYTQTQIAELTGLPLGTVKTRMRDGMRHLQTLLKDVL